MTALMLSLALAAAPAPPPRPAQPTEVTLASEGFELASAQYQAGSLAMENVLAWAARLHDAERAAGDAQSASKNLARLRALLDQANQRFAAGAGTKLDVLAAEVALARAGRGG